MQRDDEREIRARLAGGAGGLGDEVLPAAAQKGGDEHGVTEAGDREQLGDPLQETDHGGLEVAEHQWQAFWSRSTCLLQICRSLVLRYCRTSLGARSNSSDRVAAESGRD